MPKTMSLRFSSKRRGTKSKNQDHFKAESHFLVLFKAKLFDKDFSRKPFINIQILFKPV